MTRPGGLYIIGTERHESRRIDNQLRGRGPPGRPRPLALLPVAAGRSDAHLRFRPDGRHAAEARPEGRRGDRPSLDQQGAGEGAGKVEARNFDIRKNILKYDDVMNDQRKVVFEQRRDFMREDERRETIDDMRHERRRGHRRPPHPRGRLSRAVGPPACSEDVATYLNLDVPVEDWAKEEGIADDELRERIRKIADEDYTARIASAPKR
jgi:preprotein translocase subunit SecA